MFRGPFLSYVLLALPLAAHAAAGVADVAGDDPGLFLMMLMMLIAFGMALAVLLVVSFALICLFVLFLLSGILSISVVIAWVQKSFLSGLRWFLRLLFISLGMIVGMVLLVFVRVYEPVHFPIARWALICGIGGAMAGWVGYYFVSRIFRMAWNLLQRR